MHVWIKGIFYLFYRVLFADCNIVQDILKYGLQHFDCQIFHKFFQIHPARPGWRKLAKIEETFALVYEKLRLDKYIFCTTSTFTYIYWSHKHFHNKCIGFKVQLLCHIIISSKSKRKNGNRIYDTKYKKHVSQSWPS